MNARKGPTKVKGFTLIEMMIVVAVIAILAAVAIPSYMEQIRKSRRTDAQRELVSWAQALERAFTTNGTYGDCSTGTPTNTQSNKFYAFAATGANCTTNTYTLSATPGTDTSQGVDGALTLDNTGARTPADKWRN